MKDMTSPSIDDAVRVIRYLKSEGIQPLLYGSLGASLYLGAFKSCNDIDLLIEEPWLSKQWPDLQTIMAKDGYHLVDEHEHEFENEQGIAVAFAAENVLLRDKIIASLDEAVSVSLKGTVFRSLSAEQFRRAYLFSEEDGYRRDTRHKKDRQVIDLLNAYIDQPS